MPFDALPEIEMIDRSEYDAHWAERAVAEYIQGRRRDRVWPFGDVGKAMNLTSGMRQARIEADRGALVRVTQGTRLIWTNEGQQ